MGRILFICAFLCIMARGAFAQYNINEGKVWTFGYNAGVNFSSGSPVPFTTGMRTNEGCASVSDAAGNLLFYTDGDTVYNRAGSVMPSGTGITGFAFGTASTTQAATIIPLPGDPNKFYIFSLESASLGTGRLMSAMVDMSLAGGMGDIVAGSARTLVASDMGEHMVAVQGNNCDIWLIVHRQDSTKFYAYNITSSGISAPVVSNVGSFNAAGAYSIGHFMVSPDRSKLISTSFNSTASFVSNGVGAELYDLNATTGVVSNCRVLDSLDLCYGAEFSPDNSKVYICFNNGMTAPTYLNQYDVTLPTASAIIGSAYNVVTSSFAAGVYPSLKLASDNKIYLCPMDTTIGRFLDCISSPNVSGSGCGFTSHAVTLVPGTYAVFGLPSLFVTIGTVDSSFVRHDTSVCSSVGSIAISAPNGYPKYVWASGEIAQTIPVSTSGNYIAYCVNGCNLLIDTIKVTFIPYVLTTSSSDTSFCVPDSVTLAAPHGYASITWQDGSTGNFFTTTSSGVFYVDGASYCLDHVDTFHVTSKSLSFSLGPDTTVCMNYEINVPVTGDHLTYLWQDGSTRSNYSASHTGVYYVKVNKEGCDATDTVSVHFLYYSQNIHDTFICKGDPINYAVQCTVPNGGHVQWNDGLTAPNRVLTDSGTWWVFVSKDECQILDTVRINTGYCKCWCNIPEGFTPNNDGLNDVFRPQIEPGCTVSGYQFNIYNRWGELLFESGFRDKGWDGTYKGVPLDIGVYMYSLQYFVGEQSEAVTKNGSITLIR